MIMTDEQLTPFPCTACGKCCRRVNENPQGHFLDRGDGVCRHLIEDTNLCSIYEMRPIICRIGDYYKKQFADIVSWDEFVKINISICRKL